MGDLTENMKVTVSGVEEAVKKIKKLGTAIESVTAQAELIVTQFEKLGKTHINVNNINPNQSQYKLGRNNFVLRDSKEDRETKTILNKQLEKANEAELQATIAHTNALNADTEKIKKQTEQADAVLEVRQRNSKTNKKNSENRSRYLDKNMNWYKYRDEHPEMFVSRSSQTKYQWGATLSEVGHTISGLGGAGARIGGDLTSVFGMALKNGPLALATQGISKLVSGIADLSKASIQAYSEIETLKTGLSIISSTQVQADSLFRDVAGYATRSPYGVAQSTELVTLLKQSGVNDSELMSTLTMLGDTAGGNMEKLKRIANNYAQIVSIGKASMLDMRQFAYAGIPIFEAVAKELGVTQQALRGMISEGQVTSDVIEKVFKDLTSANGVFANATEIGAKTFSARKQNLADTKQLALANLGEFFINIGAGSGSNLQNEGVGRELLSFSEEIYKGLQQWADGKNIENSVVNIEKRENRIKELTDLIEYNKAQGNDAIVKDLEKELASVSVLRDIEKDRASYNAVYEKAMKAYEELRAEYPEEADFKTWSPQQVKDRQTFYANKLIGDEVLTENDVARIDQLVDYWGRAYEASLELDRIQKKWEQANIETRAIREQQRVSDLVEKSTTNPNSVYNIASQITQEYQKTEEYQQEQLEQQRKRWEETKKILLDIRKHQEEGGDLDFTKIGLSKAVDYYNKGAFSVERKLNVVEGKDREQLEIDKKILSSKFGRAITNVQDYMKKNNLNNHSVSGLLSYVKGDIAKEKETGLWYKQFSSSFVDLTNAFNSWISKETDEKTIKQLEEIRDYLAISTLGLSINTDAADFVDKILEKGSGSGGDFIPLWKRLLGGATGLSPTTIDTTRGALSAYRDDLAIRGTTKGVLRAGLQTGLGVDFVQSVLKASGEKRDDTYQIDWKKTGEAVKKFALEISNSTKILSAYKAGLEEQLSVYETVMSDILVATENQQTDKDGYVSAKTLSKLPDNYKDQLLNAFGEKLISDDGLEVSFKDGKFIDAEGNEISAENVRITGNIFDFIKEELPKIRKEIADVSIEENKRSMVSQLSQNVVDIPILTGLLTATSSNKQRVFNTNEITALSSSREFVLTDFEAQLNKVREDFAKKGITVGSNEEIKTAGVTGEAGSNLDAFNAALTATTQSLRNFLDTKGVESLMDANTSAEYERNLIAAANKLSGEQTNRYGYTSEEVSIDATKQVGMAGYMQKSFFGPMLSNIGLSPSLDISDIAKKGNISEELVKANLAAKNFEKTLEDCVDQMGELGRSALKDAFIAPFEKLGETMVNSAASMSDLKDVYAKLGADLLSNIGPLVTTVGLEMAKTGAMKGKWWMVAAGLGLAATGGVIGGLGTALNTAQEGSDDNEAERLEAIKNDLSKILEQARRDAAYYENNMRHKNALGINEKFSYRSVNDAIITPSGHVISTHPDDYLIATKQPQNLVGQKPTQPIINNIVNNNAGVSVKQEEKYNIDGSIDIITTLEAVVGNYISSSKSDDAFNVRNMRLQGRRAVM